MSVPDLTKDPLLARVPLVEGYRVLGRVALYQKIGMGGMGAVYKGMHIRMRVDRAVKILSLFGSSAPEESHVRRFLREARAAAQIDHPNLIDVHEVKHMHGVHFLVMPYVDGESAAGRARRKGGLCEQEAVEICLGAAEGLAAAHRRGIVHRDVKPLNILVGRDGKVVLADLGLAKAFAAGKGRADLSASHSMSLAMSRQIIGTPFYMSPEQTRSAGDVLPQADVWSLGVTLYQLAVGKLPFHDLDLPDLVQKIRHAPAACAKDARPGLTVGLSAICERALRKNPDERYADCGEMAEALREHLRAIRTSERSSLPDAMAGSTRKVLASVPPPGPSQLAAIVKALPKALRASPGTEALARRFVARERLGMYVQEKPDADESVVRNIRQGLRKVEELERTDPAGALVHVARTEGMLARLREEIEKARREEELDAGRRRRELERREELQKAIDALRAGRSGLRDGASSAPGLRGHRTLDVGRGVTMELVYVRPGRSSGGVGGEIARGFYIGMHPVTQAQYAAVMEENPSRFKEPVAPVENLTWAEAVAFCAGLSDRTECSFRLPTAAEWEYACRAGSAAGYCFGDSELKLRLYAWYDGNSGGRTHVVGRKRANDLGLHDVHGNVREWCVDRTGAAERPGPRGSARAGDSHVVRGGSWRDAPGSCRADSSEAREGRSDDTGFRVIMTV